MKIFVITHNLVADSGHVITVVQADTETQALEKYKKLFPHQWHIGISVEEVIADVQTVYRYDNPNYEG